MKKAIYKITNDINSKVYIGQSNNPDARWRKHKSDTLNNIDIGTSAIHDAMRHFGVEHFQLTVLGWFEDYNDKEIYYIKEYDSLVPNGYNLQEGGDEPPHKYGEEHHNSKYSNELIDHIIDDLLSRQYTQKQIELKYGVKQQLITSINRGVTHRRAGVQYPIIKTSKYHCDDETIENIQYLLANSTCTCAEIGAYFGFDVSTIKAINSGRNHHNNNINYPIRNFRGKANSQSVEAILAKRSTEAIDTPPEM